MADLPNATAEQVTALAEMPRDLAILKMENDSIMALAAARPRDYALVREDIVNQLKTFKSFAQSAMYAKPVGKDRDTGEMKYARGLSIRAAEAISAAYGYNRVRSDVTPLGNDQARIEASFVDYQTGRMWQSSTVISKTFTDFKGKTRRHNEDRFWNVVVKAETSKQVREVVLRSVPPGLRGDLEQCVDELLDEFLDESTVKKLVVHFANVGITQEQLETLIGKRINTFTKEDRRRLLQVWNAIEQEETTIADVFGATGDAAIKPPQAKPETEKTPEPEPAAPTAPTDKAEGEPEAKPQTEPPAATVPDGPVITEAQHKRLCAVLNKAGRPFIDAKTYIRQTWGYESTKAIKAADYDAICEWAAEPTSTEGS